jgi:hypothetical protein
MLKRKRSTGLGLKDESSPGSDNDDHDGDNDKKRQPGVKRACNECRQQKASLSTSLTLFLVPCLRLVRRVTNAIF